MRYRRHRRTGRRRRRPARRAAGCSSDRTDDPRWARPALWALLRGQRRAVPVEPLRLRLRERLLRGRGQVRAPSRGRRWLFGSLDSGNSITVDKPPASLWVMVLSSRIFGFSSFAMLLPQALMGVGTVALLYAAVQRWSGPAAGLVAGAPAGRDPGRRADVPVQQSGRAADAADHRGQLLRDPRHRDPSGPQGVALVAVRRGRDRVRVPDEDAAGPAGAARPSRLAYLWAGRSGLWTRIWHLLAAGAAVVRLGRLVRRCWSRSGRPTPARTSAAARPTRCGSWRSATTAWAGSSAAPATSAAPAAGAAPAARAAAAAPRRPGGSAVAASAAQPASAGCSAPRSAARSPG